VVAVVGPTASGKTELAVGLARRLQAELISADSRQVYRGCDIGTNKPTLEALQGVPCHGLDLCDPGTPFTVADYQRFATKAVTAITDRHHLPIFQGGTGLYLRAVLRGWNLAQVPADWTLRRALEARLAAEGREGLEGELAAIDPPAAARAQGNPRRLVRALEIYAVTGLPPSQVQQSDPPSWQPVIIGLQVPLAELDTRIARRVDRMLAQGLLDEVRGLRVAYPGVDLSGLGHGYREMGAVLDGRMSIADARVRIVRQVQQYARRQLTWFRAEPGVQWISPDVEGALELLQAAGLTGSARTGWVS
jgi:tRNA dimethylallyltransferase